MPYVGTNEWEFIVTDLDGGQLANITDVALNPQVGPRISNPTISEYLIPLTPTVLTTYGAALFKNGQRRIVALRNGVPVANDKVWRIKPAAGPTSGYVTMQCLGPLIRTVKAWVQDENGQIFDGPSADGTDRGLDLPAGIVANPNMTVAAGTMLEQALANRIANQGSLELSLGTFDSTPTPGGNVAFAMRNLSPMRISELIQLFNDASVLDVIVDPHGTGTSTAGTVHGLNRAGGPIAASFDFATGANNVAWAYPESDMDDFCNMLWRELGTREGSHFANNITRDAPGVTVDDQPSRDAYGVYHDIDIKPVWSGKIPNASNLFKMYVREYNAELDARIVPRTTIRITPQAGLAPEPWDDYNLGDVPGLNVEQAGIDISDGSFRIVGWNTQPMKDGDDETELLIGWRPVA